MTEELKTSIFSVGVYISNRNFIYDSEKLHEELAEAVRLFLEGKNIRTERHIQPQFGATGGEIIGIIEEFIRNHALLFAIVSRLPLIIKLSRYILRKLSELRMYVDTRQWERYERSHHFDSKLTVYLRGKIEVDSSEDALIKDAMILATNETLRILPEIRDLIAETHAEFSIDFDLTLQPSVCSSLIIRISGLDMIKDWRKQLLKSLEKINTINFPVSIWFKRNLFGNKKVETALDQRFLEYLYDYDLEMSKSKKPRSKNVQV